MLCRQTAIGETSIYTRVQDLPVGWDSFLPPYHHLKSGELAALEQAAPDGVQFAYLTLSKNNQWLGLVALQVVEIKPSQLQPKIWKNLILNKVKDLIFCKPRHLLVCGNAFRNEVPGFYFSKIEDEALLFEVMQNFERKNPFKLRFAGQIIKDWSTDLKVADQHGFAPIENDLLMEMAVSPEWTTFSDYLARLSKKYQQRARKIRQALAGIEVKPLEEMDLHLLSPQLTQLFENVVQQQPFRLSALPGSYFLSLKQVLKDRFEVMGYFLGDELVAFSSQLHRNEETLEIYYIGLNYEANEKHSLYFNLLFDGLEAAILHRKRVLKLGRSSFDAKASLGATPVEGRHLVRMKRGLPAFVFRLVATWFQSQEKPGWKSRNPLTASLPLSTRV